MRVPTELLELILLECVNSGDRAACRNLRLTSRLFDRLLKPHVCRTVCLSFRHIDRSGIRPLPRLEALDTIGTAAKTLNIDMSVVREEDEVNLLKELYDYNHTPCLRPDGRPQNLVRELRKCYLNKRTCNEKRYSLIIGDILCRCDNIRTLRLVLPNPIVAIPCGAPTRIYMNTIAAFAAAAERCHEDNIQPVHLAETIVLENFTETILVNLYRNPVDIAQHQRAFKGVRSLVLAMRDPELLDGMEYFAHPHEQDTRIQNFWSFISLAEETLESICITTADHSPRSRSRRQIARPGSPRQTAVRAYAWLPPAEHPVLPILTPPLPAVTRLEIKDVTIDAGGFLRYMARVIGPSLRELYLDTVSMKIKPQSNRDPRSCQLWIGVPNRRPHNRPPPLDLTFDHTTDRWPEWWAAPLIRDGCPRLEIVRATELSYVSKSYDALFPHHELDTRDPSGLGRTIAQRFVEVVLGYDQPDAPPDPSANPHPGLDFDRGGPGDTIDPVLGGHVRYWPYNPDDDGTCFGNLRPRPPGALRAEDHDLVAYRLAGGLNTTSHWLRSVDGAFPNVPAATDNPGVDAWIDTCLETLRRQRYAGDPLANHNGAHSSALNLQRHGRWSPPTSGDESGREGELM